MVRTGQLDATILLEEPPDFKIEGGLVYITDHVGGLTIRRCLRPSTFLKSLEISRRMVEEFMRKGNVEQLPPAVGRKRLASH